MPPEAAAALAAVRAPAQAEAVRVWPENWPALRLFLAVSTQWRWAGLAGVPTGLDYAALPVAARALRLRLDEAMLARLRVMEGAWLEAALERRA